MSVTAEIGKMDEITLCEVLQGEEIDALLSSIGIDAMNAMKNAPMAQPLQVRPSFARKSLAWHSS